MFLNLFMNCCCELKEIICFVWFIVGISHGWGVGIGDFLLRKPGLDRDWCGVGLVGGSVDGIDCCRCSGWMVEWNIVECMFGIGVVECECMEIEGLKLVLFVVDEMVEGFDFDLGCIFL